MGLYLTVLSVSVLVAGTGLTLIAVQRSDRRLQDNIVQVEEIQWYARAGLEQALLYMEQVADWRTRVSSNRLIDALPVGEGTVTVEVFDDLDGNIVNDPSHPVRLVSTGSRRGAFSRISARLAARPHPALRFALFGTSTDDLEFRATTSCRGPVRSHGKIRSAAGVTTWDDASFQTMTGYAIESPLSPASYATAAITAPAPDLSFYVAKATAIQGAYGGDCGLKGYNLTPTSNPLGSPNPQGIYHLDAAGRRVIFENLHLKGTLIVTNTAGKDVIFTRGCWIEPGPLNYPVLLVDTSALLDVNLTQASLIEATTTLTIPLNGSNYTPPLPGVDFTEDGLLLDVIPCQMRGVIWSSCSQLKLRTGSWNFAGCAIARRILIDNSVSVENDLTLDYSPMPGFLDSGMRLVQGSMRGVP